MLSQISSNNYIYTDSSSYVAGANLYSSQPQSIGSIGRPDCELEITYFNARSILPKLNKLRLLYADSSTHVGCIVETWLDDSVFDNGLTVSSYCLVRIDRNTHSGILLCIKDAWICHTMLLTQALKTLSCWELLCVMATVTVFVFVHL